jgi:hypothetical protein
MFSSPMGVPLVGGSVFDIVDQMKRTPAEMGLLHLPALMRLRPPGQTLCYAKYDRVEFRVLVVDPSRSLRGDPSGPKCRGDR